MSARRRFERGFSLLEITIALAIFGVLILVLAIVTSDMMSWQRRLPIDYMANPAIGGVVARIRKDVVDAYGYGGDAGTYKQNPDTLILQTLDESGASNTVVWDFGKKHEVHRIVFVGGAQVSDWSAIAIPSFEFTSYPEPPPDSEEVESTEPIATRIIAKDDEGRIAIDEIFYPRAAPGIASTKTST